MPSPQLFRRNRKSGLWLPGQKPLFGSRIDWSHPIVSKHNLLHYFLFNTFAGNQVIDLVNFNVGNFNNAPDWIGKTGISFANAGADSIAMSENISPLSLPASIFTRASVDDITSFLAQITTTFLPLMSGLFIQTTNAAKLSIHFRDGSGTGTSTARRTKTGTTNLVVGTKYSMGGVFRGALDMDIYLDGVDDAGTYSGSGGAYDPGTANGQVGDCGDMDYLCIFGDELSASEAYQLHVDPYQFIIPPGPQRGALFVTVATGNPLLTPGMGNNMGSSANLMTG